MLVIVGDVDVAESRRLAKGWFGSWLVGPTTFETHVPPPADPRPGPPRETVKRIPVADSDSVQVTLACRLPTAKVGDDVRYDLLSQVVSQQFFSELRMGLGASYTPSAHANVLRGGAAYLELQFSLDARRARTVLPHAQGLWRQLVSGHITLDDLRRARWRAVSQWNLAFEDSPTTMLHIMKRLNRKWPLESLGAYPQRAAQVSSAELARDLVVCGANTTMVLAGDEKVLKALGEPALTASGK